MGREKEHHQELMKVQVIVESRINSILSVQKRTAVILSDLKLKNCANHVLHMENCVYVYAGRKSYPTIKRIHEFK